MWPRTIQLCISYSTSEMSWIRQFPLYKYVPLVLMESKVVLEDVVQCDNVTILLYATEQFFSDKYYMLLCMATC